MLGMWFLASGFCLRVAACLALVGVVICWLSSVAACVSLFLAETGTSNLKGGASRQ